MTGDRDPLPLWVEALMAIAAFVVLLLCLHAGLEP